MAVLADPDALVKPAFFTHPDYHMTIGPEVADLGALFKFRANPEQRLLLDAAFGFDTRNRLPFEVVAIASRQNLKTGFLILQGLGKALLLKRPLQIWTAHKDSATDEAFLEFEKLIEGSAELSKRIRHRTRGKGDKSYQFTTGARLVFRARTGKGGQAMSADDIDLDELFAVEPQHIGSFMPTMSTRPNAQITYCSSAPHATSAYQRSIMARGRAGDPRMVYAEWSTERLLRKDQDGNPVYGPPACREQDCDHALGRQGCICDDPELVKQANPSMERSEAPSISWEYIQSERRAMVDIVEQFMRERMGVGETPASGVVAISPDLWAQRGYLGERPKPEALGVAVSLSREWGSIGACGLGGRYIGAVKRNRYGSWLLEETKRIALQQRIPVGIDERGPAASLIKPLEDAGVRVFCLGTEDYILGCTDTYDALIEERLQHGDDDDLNQAVAVAGWRQIGERRVWARMSGEISMLEAVTAARRTVVAAMAPMPEIF